MMLCSKLGRGLLLCSVLCICGEEEYPAGHMLPLGSHRKPQLVASLPTMPSSSIFYTEYVQTSTPVLLEGLLNSTNLLQNWGDDNYLRKQFGNEEVRVELKKKENRSETGFLTTMNDYLDRYRSEDIYMVTPLMQAMQEEWLLPGFLLCGGFTQNLVFSFTWFSSGGTRSVLHTDAYDNLHCVVSGVKEFLIIEPQYIDTIGPEHGSQGFYNIDVDQVDMLAHPGLESVPWYRAVVWAGDCLYLPHLWVHHVRSHNRNLGVNLWWIQFQYDAEDCTRSEIPDFAPLADYALVQELQIKQGLLEQADEDGIILATNVHSTLTLRQGLTNLKLESVVELFEILKPGCQGKLSTSDLYTLPLEIFVSAFGKFMDSIEEAAEPREEWGDNGGEWGGGGWESVDGDSGEWGYSELSDGWEVDGEEGGGDYPHDHQQHDEL